MKIKWEISQSDIKKVKDFLKEHENPFVARRISRNVKRENWHIDKDQFLKIITLCLLTTQQKSGPNSPVARFLRMQPFPFIIENFIKEESVDNFVNKTLLQNGLNRMVGKITKSLSSLYYLLQDSKWEILESIILELDGNASRETEREMANKIMDIFGGKGFGPKQSRNLLQALGLTKYEIPIDSRITSWLNNFGFPISLDSKSLSSKSYYNFVLDGFQELCLNADVYPCVLDAAIFSSFDKENWTEENAIY